VSGKKRAALFFTLTLLNADGLSHAHIVLQVLSSSWDGRQFGHNRHGPKGRGCRASFLGRAGSPSNAMSPGPRPTSIL